MTDIMRKRKLTARGAKAKGDRYERELATFFNDALGITTAQRAPLSGGGKVGVAGGADLVGVPDLFIEAKRKEKVSFREAMRQAETNIMLSRSSDIPVVITRSNNEPTAHSFVFLRLEDFITFYRAYLVQEGVLHPEQGAD